MATDARLLRALDSLEKYQKKRINTGRNLSNNNKHWEKYSEQVLRKNFRKAGASAALPRNRLKMIAKLRNVYQDAAAILNVQRQIRENNARRLANEKRRRTRPPNRVTVPSLNGVQLAKRTNGRGPNMIVVSPHRSPL